MCNRAIGDGILVNIEYKIQCIGATLNAEIAA